MLTIVLRHPREDGDPVYNYIQNSDFSLDSHLRGNDNRVKVNKKYLTIIINSML